jgi:hypothetical protein
MFNTLISELTQLNIKIIYNLNIWNNMFPYKISMSNVHTHREREIHISLTLQGFCTSTIH